MYNLDLLRGFYVVAKERSLTRAAKQLCITQSAVSQSLKQLEEHYEIVLAERSRGGFKLTEQGLLLYESCQKIFSEFHNVDEQLKNFKKEPRGEIIIGCSHTMGEAFFIPRLKPLYKEFPLIKVHLHMDLMSGNLLTLLQNETIGLATINTIFLSATDEEIEKFPISQNMHLYFFATPAYLKEHPIKSAPDLMQARFLDPNPKAPISEKVPTLFGLKNHFADVMFVNNGLKQAVLAGLGISFGPLNYIQDEIKKGKLKLILPQKIHCKRTDHLCCLKKNLPFAKYRAIFDYFKRVM